MALTFYQVSTRLNWDLASKKYAVGARYTDIEKASALYGKSKMDLVSQLNRSGTRLILFSVNLAQEKELSPPSIVSDLKRTGVTRGVEVANLQLAGEEEYAKILDLLRTVEPRFLILRGLSEVEVPAHFLEWIRTNDVILGTVEFRNRGTVERLVGRSELDWVRLHRVFDKEVGTLTGTEVRARYERAVQERNIGIIEYRLALNRNLEEQLDDLTAIRSALDKSGYRIGSVEEVRGAGSGLDSSHWLILGLIVTSSALLLNSLLPEGYKSKITLLWILATTIGGYFGLSLAPTLTKQLVSLGIAVTAPLLGYKLLRNYGLSFGKGFNLLYPTLDLIWISIYSTFIGLVITSLLLDESFVLKLQQFRGVKVSLFFPLLLLVFVSSYYDKINLSKIKFNYKTGILAAGLLGLFLFLLFRSGNFGFLRSGDLEEAIRRWLENTLYVRPRFKEFALGHPSLIAWLYLAGHYPKKYRFCKLGLLLLGFMGQISIINTFAHIHTPIVVSLIRTVNGLAGGIILGAIFLAVILGGEYLWNLRKR